jgi:tetratricopeptide (TPR) repeat protein
MAQKRISRARKRDLERPDEFLTLSSRLMEKISLYWKPISAGFCVLLVVLGGILVFRYFSDKAEDKAFVMLNQALMAYAAGQENQDLGKALEAVTPDFNTLISQYGNRQGGMAARLAFARMNFQAGRMETAIAHYTAASKLFPEGSLGASAAWSGLGYALAAAGQHEKAIAAFAKVVDGSDAVLKADALYQRALLYRKTGQDADYNKSLQTLREKYPAFMYAELLPEPTEG